MRRPVVLSAVDRADRKATRRPWRRLARLTRRPSTRRDTISFRQLDSLATAVVRSS